MALSPKVHPDKAKAKIEEFLRNGASVQTIATAAGLHPTVLHRIRSNGCDLIERETQRKILNAKPEVGPHIDVTGTRRRLQAIAALGYSLADVHDATGVSANLITNIRIGKNMSTTPATATAIAGFYEIIKDTPAAPPMTARRAAAFAEKFGWSPPAAWESRDINDPAVGPGEYDAEQNE
jgi:transcriptional regulator with XRE-family HTH domain